MSPRAAKFTQADVKRAIKGAKAAGENARVELRPDGVIVIIPVTKRETTENENEWDGVK